MKSMIKKIIKKFFNSLGYSIVPNKNKILKNVFNTNFKENVLISYIQQPFLRGIKKSHTNYLECYTAAEIFRELGYNVDVIDFMSKRNIVYNNYSIVYGFGYPLENAFYSNCAEKLKKILYCTGTNRLYFNKVSGLKIMKFYQEKGKIIPEAARLEFDFWTLQFIMPDLNITLGNDFVANTSLEINPSMNVKMLPIFYYDCYDIDLSQKNFKEAKKHFIWFGSNGLVYKGLDILIDIFSARDDIFLHICGAPKGEKKFFDYYQAIIERSHNIIDHGFVDIDSADFKKLMDSCAFVLFASVSEGSAPGVVTTMANGGLIPIISKASGLDVEEFGYVFENIEANVILEYINEALGLSEEQLYKKSLTIKENVREIYSHKNYRQNLQKIIKEEISR